MTFDKHKVWRGLGAALLAGTSLGTGALAHTQLSPSAETGSLYDAGKVLPQGGQPVCAPAEGGEGGEGGEAGEGGEGGEGGEAGERGNAPDLASSDPAYLTQLGLIRGHLDIGMELYRMGELKAAASHMKHPEDELYASMKEALQRRGVPGFEKELDVLAERVENNAQKADTEAAYNDVVAAITRAENAVSDPTPYVIGQVIHELVRNAALEYSEAIADGKVVEGHEYQDARGFVHIAGDWLGRLEGAGANKSVVDSIRKQMDLIEPAWPSPVPPKSVSVEPSVIHGAAARIEIAVLDLTE